MAKTVMIFGNIYILKKNPWFTRKFRALVEKGLAKPKKDYILSKPVPWFFDVSTLSQAQVAQIMRFTRAAMRRDPAVKEDMETRITRIKAQASGPIEGIPKKAPRPLMPKIGKIVTLARAYKIAVPAEVESRLATIQAAQAAQVTEVTTIRK